MWCKDGFTSGDYTIINNKNPYIDYTVYYNQTQDYSLKNSSGIAKNLSYTSTYDDYYQGGDKIITGNYDFYNYYSIIH